MAHKPESEDVAAGWQAILDRNLEAAESAFQTAVNEDPAHVDGWNGLGAVQFERGNLKESLLCYERALEEALNAHDGALPKKLSWNTDRPTMRAIHGIGLNNFRMGNLEEAAAAFEDLLARNPEDNQGTKFLLSDIKKKKDLWKKH